MATDLIELLRYHELIERGVDALSLVRVGRVPAWLGSSHTRLVDSVPQPPGPTWRVFRSRDALHVLVPADDDGWYIGDVALPERRSCTEPVARLDHRFADRSRNLW